ncbi:MAG: macro domain-containing protein, partial [Firmicutes bacterium]|nr:macro domain-containing protein [Bacillota bacterium]
IHTVGPVYHSRADDADMLANCYKNTMELAVKNDIHSIAFPAISTGVYGYPKDKACNVAVNTIKEWLSEHSEYAADIYFVCFDDETYDLYKGLI